MLPTEHELLIVEDNPGDFRMLQVLVHELPHAPRLHHVETGQQALDFLQQRGPHRDAPRPTLILLDLNLLGHSGFELLASLKADEELRTIPVVIFTSSSSSRDVRRAYQLHANAYVS